MSEKKSTIEEMKVAANDLVDRVQELIKEGRTRRVSIKKGDHVYMEIPLSVGLGSAMATIWLAPTLAAVAAIAAIVTDVELVVERFDEAEIVSETDEDTDSDGISSDAQD
jgi:hypothetical protein